MKGYTTTEIEEIRSYYLKDLLPVDEIAELMGRTKKAIINIIHRNGWHRKRGSVSLTSPSKTPIKREPILMSEEKDTPKTIVEDAKVIITKTLDDFTPREIFRHLHKLGYRFAGEVYCIVKQKVNINDIVKENV